MTPIKFKLTPNHILLSSNDDPHEPFQYHASLHQCHYTTAMNTEDTSTITYFASKHVSISNIDHGLINGGANRIIAGEECIWIGGPSIERKVNVTGIDKYKELMDIPIGKVGTLATSNQGPVILIINKVAYTGRHTTILSWVQMEVYYNNVGDRLIKLGDRQRIITPKGYVFPLSITKGLPYLKMRRYSQHEFDFYCMSP